MMARPKAVSRSFPYCILARPYNLVETLRRTETSGASANDQDVDVDFLAIGLADLPLVSGCHVV